MISILHDERGRVRHPEAHALTSPADSPTHEPKYQLPAPADGIPHPSHVGLRLGLAIAAVTWIWVAIVDALTGTPFATPTVLGGVLAFTVAHVLLCLALGAALVALMEAAREEPGLVFAVVFGMLLLEVAFAMLTVLISTTALGGGAWLRIFVGSLAGSLVAFVLLARWYPLGALVHHAETRD